MAGEGNARYASVPDVAVIASNASGMARGRSAIEAAGAQLVFVATIDEGAARLDATHRLDAVLVIVDGDETRPFEDLLAQLNRSAVEGQHRSVVSVPFDLVDRAHGLLDHRDVELVCEASTPELVGALGLATVRRPATLHDPKGERTESRLLRISEEVGRIAKALAALSQAEPGSQGGRSDLGEAGLAYRAEPRAAPELDADRVRKVIRMRRLRDRFFDPGLFADPAWDMLLDLTAARLEKRDVAVSSLCIAAAVPPTTALRWIKAMTEAGLFERRADPRDGRRVFIALADDAALAVEAWFAAAGQEGGSAFA